MLRCLEGWIPILRDRFASHGQNSKRTPSPHHTSKVPKPEVRDTPSLKERPSQHSLFRRASASAVQKLSRKSPRRPSPAPALQRSSTTGSSARHPSHPEPTKQYYETSVPISRFPSSQTQTQTIYAHAHPTTSNASLNSLYPPSAAKVQQYPHRRSPSPTSILHFPRSSEPNEGNVIHVPRRSRSRSSSMSQRVHFEEDEREKHNSNALTVYGGQSGPGHVRSFSDSLVPSYDYVPAPASSSAVSHLPLTGQEAAALGDLMQNVRSSPSPTYCLPRI